MERSERAPKLHAARLAAEAADIYERPGLKSSARTSYGQACSLLYFQVFKRRCFAQIQGLRPR